MEVLRKYLVKMENNKSYIIEKRGVEDDIENQEWFLFRDSHWRHVLGLQGLKLYNVKDRRSFIGRRIFFEQDGEPYKTAPVRDAEELPIGRDYRVKTENTWYTVEKHDAKWYLHKEGRRYLIYSFGNLRADRVLDLRQVIGMEIRWIDRGRIYGSTSPIKRVLRKAA